MIPVIYFQRRFSSKGHISFFLLFLTGRAKKSLELSVSIYKGKKRMVPVMSMTLSKKILPEPEPEEQVLSQFVPDDSLFPEGLSAERCSRGPETEERFPGPDTLIVLEFNPNKKSLLWHFFAF